MIELSSGTLLWFAAGILLLILGVLIRSRGWLFLLAGYDESASVPDDVIQNIAGNTVLRIGGVQIRMKDEAVRFLSGQCSKSHASATVATASS
ncbi:hypothetical protein EI982_02595 [Haloplanus rallus]|uniref:Uncharacterized protein n=1 Tax=Haloplanus rallus TaxID=1816183 RepID=A0A6B9F5S4_9EURY|nr:hypothetical protein EI982_02595 [Haloplanus rallus]